MPRRSAPDGRYVAFPSEASNLVAGDTNGQDDVFVRDVVAGTTERVSMSSAGNEGTSYSLDPSISGDGRFVAFDSAASNLVPGDTNAARDVFVRDRLLDKTRRISVSAYGVQGNGGSDSAVINASAGFVAFSSNAANLVDGDTNNERDVFVRELVPETFVDRDPAELFGFEVPYGYASDPVNTATGNFVHTETDLDFPGDTFGLDWSSTYNSGDPMPTTVGRGWTHSFATRLVETPDGSLTYVAPDGRHATFTPDGSGWTRPAGVAATPLRLEEGGLELSFDNGRTETFDMHGRLVHLANWDGQAVELTWTAGLLTGAETTTGRSLEFGYGNGLLTSVTADDGRTVTFTRDAERRLVGASRTDGGATAYALDGYGRITSVTDADGVLQIANSYGGEGRVDGQTTPSGETVTFSYDAVDGVTTTHGDAFDSTVRYSHDRRGQLRSITDPYGMVVTRTYDGEGNLVASVDRRQAATTQTFDSRGNLLTRAGPEGVTESFTYDSSSRLLSATDGELKTTTFTYEGAERLPTTIIDGNGKTTTNDDGSDGLLVSTTDADGLTTTSTTTGNATRPRSPTTRARRRRSATTPLATSPRT